MFKPKAAPVGAPTGLAPKEAKKRSQTQAMVGALRQRKPIVPKTGNDLLTG